MSKNYYRNRLERDPGYGKILAEKSRLWRAKKLAEDPEYLAAENFKKRRSEKLRGGGSAPPKKLRTSIVARARRRARKAGIEATLKVGEVIWPDRCPVLGIVLDYATPRGERTAGNPALPSLDRWDNTKGYVAGNVYVISLRANYLKSDATADELARVAAYAASGPGALLAD